MTNVIDPATKSRARVLTWPHLLTLLAVLSPVVAVISKPSGSQAGSGGRWLIGELIAVALLASTMLFPSPRPGHRFNVFKDAPLGLVGIAVWVVGLPLVIIPVGLLVKLLAKV